MKLYFKDNQVWLDLENYKADGSGYHRYKQQLFLGDYYGCFERKDTDQFLFVGNSDELNRIIIKFVRSWGIQIDEQIYKYYIEKRIQDDKDYLLLLEENNIEKFKEKAVKKWETKKINGCFPCEHLKQWNDDLFCDVNMNKPLTTKCENGIINGNHCLFIQKAYPNKDCPYRVEEKDNG